jgi:preprotein translocase subunit SecY
LFLMWLGEQIDEYGLGNGISLIILAGIVARMPVALGQLVATPTSASAPRPTRSASATSSS